MAEYNPFKDFNPAFTQYQYLKTPKVTIKNPVFGNQEFSDGFIERNGTYIAPPNTPETQEYVTNNYDDLFKEMGNRHYENSPTISSNIKGDQKTLAINIVNALVNRSNGNIKPEQASAIVGHLIAESGLTPSKINGNDLGATSGGLGQWRGERFTKLKQFAKNQGKTWNNLDTQVDFLIHELSTDYQDVYNKLISANNPTDASKAWSYYEKFAGYDNNISSAKKLQRSKGWSDSQTLKWIQNEHSKRENNSNEVYELWKQSRNA